MAEDKTTAESWWKEKPWWAPDAQGFVIGAVVFMVGVALFYRMTHPAEINDKLLDMMLTILFGTAFVAIINYLVGSSRGSQAKDETQNKIMEKLTSGPPQGPVAPVPWPPPATAPVVAWWSLLTPGEQVRISGAAANDQRIAAFIAAAQAGKAISDDLTYLVSKGLLSDARGKEISTS
jgi:hypothetical protein